ncbi:nuclear transport factor 2 family protein [Aliirhizobium smilacinae]|uniref:nuclear transport factor 2 family protein n=1 Tax=Aliirhizobium smilacinae TaxID=1395944 RepID=UPI0015D64FAD|nr:DUF4440 domain-containing protein [Rhizobium smilacinae]
MPDLDAHLFALEAAIQTKDVRSSKKRLLEMLAPDFREFGRSGKRYDLEEILSGLTTEVTVAKTAIEDFTISHLSETVVLATYRGIRFTDDKIKLVTNRSSIWRLDADGNWRMVFHQGTPAA